MIRWMALGLAMAAGLQALAADRRTDPEAEVSVVVVLSHPPLSELAPRGVRAGAAAVAVANPRTVIRRQQDSVEAELANLGGTVTQRFEVLLNALVARIPRARIPQIRGLSGVESVCLERQFRPALSTSVPFIGTPEAWGASGADTGAGIRIGIIDSGIDYLHADFGGSGNPAEFVANNPTLIEPGTFPTAKVVGGYDFVGDDFDGSGENGSTTARPDPDPLDTAGNGHGTHVAGIAAGIGVLTNGLPFPGPYSATLPFSQFLVGPGVAPEALLYAYKVFGRSGSTTFSVVIAAMERALDPNLDGDFTDHLDVINLSLGTPFGLADASEPEVQAVNRLSARGVIVVVAAGNNGNTHFVCASPGVAASAITVANSFDNGATFTTIQVTAPASIAGSYAAVEAAFTPSLSKLGTISAPVAATLPALACGELLNPGDLVGRIALIDRGSCFFVDKIRRAQNAGAVAVLVVNNADGAPTEMGGQGDTTDIRIPALMISRLDGSILRGKLGSGLAVTLEAAGSVVRPELADQLNESSSRGPSSTDGRLKPDVSAPGTSITSADSGTGTLGVALSGTSMAAPHVAGAAALLRQRHPGWTVEDIKAALMNTSTPVVPERGGEYPRTRGGAGRIRINDALGVTASARADSDQGEVSLSFGVHEISEPLSVLRFVRISNLGGEPATFRVAVSNAPGATGVDLVPQELEIVVPASGSGLLPLRMDLVPAAFRPPQDATTPAFLGDRARQQLPEATGDLWIFNGATALKVPWYVVARATDSHQATISALGAPAAPVSTVFLPTRGSTAHPQPLVSVFDLGFEGSPGPVDSGTLLAAGAATDFLNAEDPSAARLFIGLATSGKWTTPQYEFLGLEAEIDTNDDGRAEFILLNSSAGNLNGQNFGADLSNDALMTLVMNASLRENFFTAGGLLNVLPPSFRDTAPYHNRVAILSAPVQSLGLGAGRTRFRYRITTTGLRDLFQTETPWIDYDLAHPLVDATPHGLLGAPLFDEGRDVRVLLHRDDAIGLGYGTNRPVRALLLHQHGADDHPLDLVSIHLEDPDLDRDGLPDAWELEWFGDLGFSADEDSDLDGTTNAAEWKAETNPLGIRVTSLDPLSGTLRWEGPASRFYTVESAPSLDGPFSPRIRHVPGTAGGNAISDPELQAGAGTAYFRVIPE